MCSVVCSVCVGYGVCGVCVVYGSMWCGMVCVFGVGCVCVLCGLYCVVCDNTRSYTYIYGVCMNRMCVCEHTPYMYERVLCAVRVV